MTERERNPLGMRLSAIALLLGIFVAGAAAGAAMYRWGAHDCGRNPLAPGMHPPRALHGLGLSEQQRQHVDGIMRKHHPEIDAILRESFPRLKAIHEKIDLEIRPILTEEQRSKFDQMRAHRAAGQGMGEMGFMGGPPRHPHGPTPDGMPPRDAPMPPQGISMPPPSATVGATASPEPSAK